MTLIKQIRSVGLLVLAIGVVGACGGKKSSKPAGRSGGESANLEGKHISDDEFLCTLPADYGLLAGATTYTGEVAALLETSCVGCHKPGATAPDLSTYDAAMAAADLSLEVVQGGSMPPSAPLAAADKALLQSWVDGGLLETPSAPSPSAGPKPAPESSSSDDVSEFCDAQGYDEQGAGEDEPAEEKAP